MKIRFSTIIALASGSAALISAHAADASLQYFTEVTTLTAVVTTDTGQLSSPTASLFGSLTSFDGSQGNAYGEADLPTAELHAAAGPTTSDFGDYGYFDYGFPAFAIAQMGDVLTFRDLPTGQSTISFDLHVDGTLSSGGCCSGEGLAQVVLQLGTIDNSSWEYLSENVSQPYQIGQSWYGTPATVDYDAIGSITVNGPEAIVPIYIELYASGQYGRADFSDTASFTFTDIPVGASFTSASGSFLAGGAVPEPSTWAMALLGFAGLGFMASRRRLTVTVAG